MAWVGGPLGLGRESLGLGGWGWGRLWGVTWGGMWGRLASDDRAGSTVIGEEGQVAVSSVTEGAIPGVAAAAEGDIFGPGHLPGSPLGIHQPHRTRDQQWPMTPHLDGHRRADRCR